MVYFIESLWMMIIIVYYFYQVLMDLAGDHGLYSDLDRAKLCDTKEETEKLLESLTEEPTDGKTVRNWKTQSKNQHICNVVAIWGEREGERE